MCFEESLFNTYHIGTSHDQSIPKIKTRYIINDRKRWSLKMTVIIAICPLFFEAK